MRCVRTRVLPEPAPATTSNGPPRCTTASSWSGFRPSRSVRARSVLVRPSDGGAVSAGMSRSSYGAGVTAISPSACLNLSDEGSHPDREPDRQHVESRRTHRFAVAAGGVDDHRSQPDARPRPRSHPGRRLRARRHLDARTVRRRSGAVRPQHDRQVADDAGQEVGRVLHLRAQPGQDARQADLGRAGPRARRPGWGRPEPGEAARHTARCSSSGCWPTCRR